MFHRTGWIWMVSLAAGMGLWASAAEAGWVIESESNKPRASATGAPGKAGEAVPGKMEENPVQKYTMRLEGNFARLDSGNVSIVFDLESGDQYVMLHDRGVYMVMTEKDVALRRRMERNPGGWTTQPAEPEAKVKAVATGKTDKINGYSVEEYVAKLPDQTMTFWVSKDGADAKTLREGMLAAYQRVLANTDNAVDMKSLPGYPIRTVVEMSPRKTKLKDGMVIATPGKKTTHLVTSIKQEKIDSEVFKVPDEYERAVMPSPETQPAGGAKTAPAPFGKKPATAN
jgi:hypothetical protein